MLQLSLLTFRKDSYIFVEGKFDTNRFFIIQTGKVRLFREVEILQEAEGNILGPGDFIGVISCMSGHGQIENAVALSDVTAISVRKDQFPELIEKNTVVAMKLIYFFAKKMRFLNEGLTQVTFKNNAPPSPEQLYTVASYYDKMGNFNLAFFAYYQYLKACPQGGFVEQAKKRFIALKQISKATGLEPTSDLIVQYPKGQMIFSEFQTGQDMFIIQEGQVKITKVVDNNEVILAVLKKGDFFGEMALLENKPRSASAIAHESCKLMCINRKNFDQMVSSQPQLIARLTMTLSDRLWGMYMQLRNTIIIDPVARLFDMLILQLEKNHISTDAPTGYTFEIGPMELANMCSIPKSQQNDYLAPFLKDSKVRLEGNKIHIINLVEAKKVVLYARKAKKANN